MAQIISVPINGLGAVGIITDIDPYELPLNAWSAGQNVRCRDGYLEKFLGDNAVFGTPSIVPYWLLPCPTPATYFWLYAGLAKVFTTDGITHTDITRTVGGDYTAAALSNWTGCVLGNIPVINNGVDDPQMWLPIDPATKLALLSNWPASTKCKALRGYKNYLIAMDVTKSGNRFPQMVKWSHGAAAGSVPSSWDPADATKDAGEYLLAETSGFILDSMLLKDVNMVYKEDSVYGMQYIGGINIFRFYRVQLDLGILSRRCVCEIPGGRHALFSPGDLVWHDGQNVRSIADSKMRKFLFNRIDSANIAKSFVVHLYRRGEVWFCYPQTGSLTPDQAVIWNYLRDTTTVRDLKGISHIEPGLVNPGATSDTWDGDSGSWDSDATAWDTRNFNPANKDLLEAGTTDTKLYRADDGTTFNGTNMTAFVERQGIGIPLRENDPPDTTTVKYFDGIWPRIQGTTGGVLQIYIGTHEDYDSPAVYNDPVNFTIGTDDFVDISRSGRLMALKIASSTAIEWRISGYEVDVGAMGVANG